MLVAQGMGGLGCADIVLTAAQGATNVAAVTARANADAQFSISATASLANYAVQSQSAATKALRDGVKSETKYDLQRIKAPRDYDDALAAANVVWTAKYVEIQVAIYLDEPIPHVPADYQNPAGMTDETNREARIAKALEAIEKEYQAAEKPPARHSLAKSVTPKSPARAIWGTRWLAKPPIRGTPPSPRPTAARGTIPRMS